MCMACPSTQHPLRVTSTTQGVGGGVEAARAGHEVVMCPTSHCYFDYKQAAHEQEPGAWYAMLPLSVRDAAMPVCCPFMGPLVLKSLSLQSSMLTPATRHPPRRRSMPLTPSPQR